MNLVDQLGETVPGPCPALTLDNGQYKCGIVMHPKKYIRSIYDSGKLREAFKVLIGAGNGCDELGEEFTPEQEKQLEEFIDKYRNDPDFLTKLRAAMKVIHNIKL